VVPRANKQEGLKCDFQVKKYSYTKTDEAPALSNHISLLPIIGSCCVRLPEFEIELEDFISFLRSDLSSLFADFIYPRGSVLP